MRRAMAGHRDPIITARFVIGRVWPLLLTLVFGSALIGNGVTGGWFVWDNPDVTRLIFLGAAVAALLTAVVWQVGTILVCASVIVLVSLGRCWAITSTYVESRHMVSGGTTTLLVGSFIWLALALAEVMFAIGLMTLTVPPDPAIVTPPARPPEPQ